VSLLTRAMGRALGLPRRSVRRVIATRDIAVPMSDGVTLRADHYEPGIPGAATVLIRTPYGRGGPVRLLARAVAERGLHVVVQSCRGTFDSGGEFEPMRNERADGLDTLKWLADEPWYTGELCTYGPSYVGFVQWALAAEAGPQLKAMATVVTASQFRDATYPGGSFSLDTVLTWASLIHAQRGPRLPNLVELVRGQPRLQRGLRHLPLREADLIATGAQIAFYREWLTHVEPADEYWRERGHRERVAEIGVPILMVGGWHDIFLPWQLEDYAALRAAGARPYLTIGPWTHGSLGLLRTATAESITWFRAHTGADRVPLRENPVRIFVTGLGQWRDLPDWPPPSRTRDWHLQPGGGLATATPPVQAAPDRFVYDPADPTPALGGPRLIANRAGPRDNRPIETRPDVLVYTGDRLAAPVEVIGPVSATLHLRTDGEYFDMFVRLCDVAPSGRSVNVCDGLVRVLPGRFPPDTDGVRAIEVPLWPVAHRFLPGHRIRVQVSGGAHPRFARNPGTGALLGEEGDLRAVAREVFHTAGRASAIHLPVTAP
jgi:putative CocE/NonD family hydrolase